MGLNTLIWKEKPQILKENTKVVLYNPKVGKWSEVAQSCPTLCDPMDSSLPGSSVHGILQARILEWAAVSFSRRSSRHRDRTRVSHTALPDPGMEPGSPTWQADPSRPRDGARVSHTAGRRFTTWASREAAS